MFTPSKHAISSLESRPIHNHRLDFTSTNTHRIQLPTINFIRSIFAGARSASPNTVMAAKTKAQDIIDNNSVAVFSKSYCPYCKATKSLLSEMGAKPFIIELDQVGT